LKEVLATSYFGLHCRRLKRFTILKPGYYDPRGAPNQPGRGQMPPNPQRGRPPSYVDENQPDDNYGNYDQTPALPRDNN